MDLNAANHPMYRPLLSQLSVAHEIVEGTFAIDRVRIMGTFTYLRPRQINALTLTSHCALRGVRKGNSRAREEGTRGESCLTGLLALSL